MDQKQDFSTGTIPGVPPVPPKPPVPPRAPAHKSAAPEFPQHPNSGDNSVPRKSPNRTILIAAAAVLVLVLVVLLFPKGDASGSSMADSLPTQRQMISDAKSVLSANDIDCKVLNLQIAKDNLSERFKTYTAECILTISESGTQSEMELKLQYKFENDQWTLVVN